MSTRSSTPPERGEGKTYVEEGLIAALVFASAGAALAAAPLAAIWPAAARAVASLRFELDQALVALLMQPQTRLLAAFLAALLLMAVLVGAGWGFIEFVKQPTEWHRSGAQVLRDWPAIEALQRAELALMSSAQRPPEPGLLARLGLAEPPDRPDRVHGVVIGGVELSRTREVGHTIIAGLPGSGKTTIISAIIAQALWRGDRAIIHDPKGDFAAALWSGEDSAVMLGPWDARASWWDVASDIDTPEAAATFAAAFFPSEGGGQNQYFLDAARELLTGLIVAYQRDGISWTLADLAADLAAGGEALVRKAARGNPQIGLLIPDTTTPGAKSVLSTLASATGWLAGYAAAFKTGSSATREGYALRPFSWKKWLAGEDTTRVVLLNNNLTYAARAEQLFGAMLAALSAHANGSSMPERDPDAQGIWVIMDEFPQLGKAASRAIQTLEELGRSRGIRVVKAVQDQSQLFAGLGREAGEAARSMQQTRIYCKLSASAAADLSRQLGEREVERLEAPLAVGAGNKRIVVHRLPVADAATFTGLKVRKGGEEPQGVEILVHIDDLLCVLVQPFANLRTVSLPLIESNLWRRGILAVGPDMAAPAAQPPAPTQASDEEITDLL